jgi:hypothetical protein
MLVGYVRMGSVWDTCPGGLRVTPGPDSASTNTSSLVMQNVTVPAFYETDASRQSSIESIAGYVERALAPYSIDVVLTRPASGDYYMTVMGGTSQAIIGTPNVLSVAPGVCDYQNRNRISLVFDLGSNTPQYYATSILSDFGALVGMSPTAKAGDCMCRGGTVCSGPFSGMLCSFGVDVPVQTDNNGCGRTTQNEPMHLAAALGCR